MSTYYNLSTMLSSTTNYKKISRVRCLASQRLIAGDPGLEVGRQKGVQLSEVNMYQKSTEE